MTKWGLILLVEADAILLDGACLIPAVNWAFWVLFVKDHNALGKLIEIDISEIKCEPYLAMQLPFTVYERSSAWNW